MRVLVVDDHRLFRQGLIGLMKTRRDLVDVVGQAASGHEAIQLAEQLKPDVVLMDICMQDGDGMEATAHIRAHCPNIAIVILTASESDEDLYRAVQLGAAGYLLKDLDADQLFEVLLCVEHGEAAMTRETASRLLKCISRRSTEPERGEEPLTEREMEVLCLAATGASNQEIADRLSISVNTAKTHVRNILDKLQLDNRTQAANYALQRGLVSATNHERGASLPHVRHHEN
ncbi:MAG: response regulator transcription factor [Chloroflexi bacterium]|nr:response regulator transcription factor [Chloroflexota bacterium]